MTTNPSKPPIILTDPEDRSKLPQRTPHQPSLDYLELALSFLSLGARNPDVISEEDDDRLMSAGSQLMQAAETSSHADELVHMETALQLLHECIQQVDVGKLDDPDFLSQAISQLKLAKTALEQGQTLVAPPEPPNYAKRTIETLKSSEETPHPAGSLYARGIDYLACYYRDNPDAEGEFDHLRDETLEKIQEARAAFIRANEHHDPDIERIYLQHVLDAVNEAQRAWRMDEGRDNVLLKQLLPRLEARRDALDGHSQEPPDLPPRG